MIAAIFTPILMSAAASSAQAQNAGMVSGSVLNAGTGSYLEGALVSVEGTGIATLSDRAGRFQLRSVPTGQQTLVVTYTGLDEARVPVQVRPGSNAIATVQMNSDVYVLEEFRVAGEREGSAAAITAQRHAPNVKSVVATEAFGNIVDGNIGEFLKRTSGIATELNEGEVSRIFVRGIGAGFSAVTLDGTRLPSPSFGKTDRSFRVDKLPADYIESIEVFKAPTPDMDADSVGGAVNLVTKSAFDLDRRSLTYNFVLSHKTLHDKTSYSGGIQYSDVLGEKNNLGLFFTSSYNEVYVPQDNSQMDFAGPADRNGNVTDHWMWRFRVADGDHLRTRSGHGLKLDYRLSEQTTLFASLMYNYFEDNNDNSRYTWQGRDDRTGGLEPGYTSLDTTHTDARYETFNTERRERQDLYQFQIGGETELEDYTIDYSASYAPAEETLDRNDFSFQTGRKHTVRMTRDSFSDHYGEAIVIDGPDVNDLNDLGAPNLSRQFGGSTETIWGGELNVKRFFDQETDTFLKTGIRYRGQELDIDTNRTRNEYVGDGDYNELFAKKDWTRLPNEGRHPLHTWPDAEAARSSLFSDPANWETDAVAAIEESLTSDGKAREDVYAAYLMGNRRFHRLNVLAGIRFEKTDVTATGPLVQELTTPEPDDATEEQLIERARLQFGGRQTNESSYQNWFPGVHFRYDFDGGLVARASYSTSIGRPDFGDIIPTTDVSLESERVRQNNTGLQPQEADNFDLGLEFYFEPVGVLSAGVFHKEIRNFIFTDVTTIPSGPDNGFGGDYAQYELVTQRNGGTATVTGVEFNYNQQLGGYADWLQGFSVFANMTHIEAEGNYNTEGGESNSQLVEFVPNSGNAGIVYDRNKWTIRFQMNYNDRYLNEYISDPNLRIYDDERWDGEVRLKYAFSRKFAVFAEMFNAFNPPIVRSQGLGLYWPQKIRYNGRRINFGISGRF